MGTFGDVYKCVDLKTAELVAIKKLKKVYTSLEEAYSLREVAMLRSVSHPNIVELKRVDLEKSKLHMVFELSDYNLTDFMRDIKEQEGRELSEIEIKLIIKQCLIGMEYIH